MSILPLLPIFVNLRKTRMNKEYYQHSYVMHGVDFGIPVLGLVKVDLTIQRVTYQIVGIWRLQISDRMPTEII